MNKTVKKKTYITDTGTGIGEERTKVVLKCSCRRGRGMAGEYDQRAREEEKRQDILYKRWKSRT